MALETATYIPDLNTSNPASGDPVSQSDDHHRLIKSVLKNTLPNLGGAMNASHTELNRLVGSLAPLIDRGYGEYTTNADIVSTIPLDDTIPQNTEGTQIISVAFTPKSTTNRLRLRFQGQVSGANAVNAIAAIFSSASANALAADVATTTGANFQLGLGVEYEYVPATTSALTFTVRVGTATGATMRMNGLSNGRLFGGVSRATLTIEEFAV